MWHTRPQVCIPKELPRVVARYYVTPAIDSETRDPSSENYYFPLPPRPQPQRNIQI